MEIDIKDVWNFKFENVNQRPLQVKLELTQERRVFENVP